MGVLRFVFLAVDLAFVLYWTVTGLHLVPSAWLFKDYAEPIVDAWNWSFLPLDLAVSATGLSSVWLASRKDPRWAPLAFASLVLTSCSGLMAIAFWTMRCDFAIGWWLPNVALLAYPFFFFGRVARAWMPAATTAPTA